MPDTKITALTAIGANPIIPATFPIPMVDLTDTSMAASGTTKKVTVNQILGAGGTATLASATITGALAANADTTLGTASKSTNTNLNFSSDLGTQRIYIDRGTRSLVFQDVTSSIENYRIAGITGVHTWGVGGTTAMTLNSTGLGVGVSPTGYGILALKKDNTSAPPYIVLDNRGTGGTDTNTYTQGGILFGAFRDVSNPAYIASITVERKSAAGGASSTGDLIFGTASTPTNGVATERLRIDSTGNVGIGVTPNTWTVYKALQVNSASVWSTTGNDTAYASNVYYDGGYKFRSGSSDKACMYIQFAGQHQWHYTASAGTAGNTAAFTQAMTLDASGNLLVAATSSSLTTGTGFKVLSNSGTTLVGTVGASSSDVDTTYRLYSSTASAYRFYVGYGGTVYATNTTISAISDARLKENVQDIDVGLGAILALKPRKFDWKTGKGKDIKGDRGFIAQEFETVFPQLVDEWADPAPEGEAPYKSVRQDLIPVLVKAIQELTARVQTLEAK